MVIYTPDRGYIPGDHCHWIEAVYQMRENHPQKTDLNEDLMVDQKTKGHTGQLPQNECTCCLFLPTLSTYLITRLNSDHSDLDTISRDFDTLFAIRAYPWKTYPFSAFFSLVHPVYSFQWKWPPLPPPPPGVYLIPEIEDSGDGERA